MQAGTSYYTIFYDKSRKVCCCSILESIFLVLDRTCAFPAKPVYLEPVAANDKACFRCRYMLHIMQFRIVEIDDFAAILTLGVIMLGHIRIEPAGAVAISKLTHKSGFDKYLQVVVHGRYAHAREASLQRPVNLVSGRMRNRVQQV